MSRGIFSLGSAILALLAIITLQQEIQHVSDNRKNANSQDKILSINGELGALSGEISW
jgi:hypothetical protein